MRERKAHDDPRYSWSSLLSSFPVLLMSREIETERDERSEKRENEERNVSDKTSRDDDFNDDCEDLEETKVGS